MAFRRLSTLAAAVTIQGQDALNQTQLISVSDGVVGNPFLHSKWYRTCQGKKQMYDESIASADGEVKANLEGMKNVAVAKWVRASSQIEDADDGVRGTLQNAKSDDELVVFVLFDLPNRNCAAKDSVPEFCCARDAKGQCDFTVGGDCKEGLESYKADFIDKFVNEIKNFPDVPVVVILEPDALPNLVTNQHEAWCSASGTRHAYEKGIHLAVAALKKTHAAVYLDAGHGHWMGNFVNNIVKRLKDVVSSPSDIRGFSQNLRNYYPVGEACPWEEGDKPAESRNLYCFNHALESCCKDRCGFIKANSNPYVNEMNYAKALRKAAEKHLSWSPSNVIDTSRNGVDSADHCGNGWCNPRDVGTGALPSSSTGADFVDAFYWFTVPGISDGCSKKLPDGSQCAAYDTACGSKTSVGSREGEPPAPPASEWFDFQAKALAKKAADTNWPTSRHCDEAAAEGDKAGAEGDKSGAEGDKSSGAGRMRWLFAGLLICCLCCCVAGFCFWFQLCACLFGSSDEKAEEEGEGTEMAS